MEILIGLLLMCAAWAVVAGMLIVRDRERRGLPVNFFWLRWKMLGYVHQYQVVTRQESGRTGPLFYHFIVTLIMALALAVAMVWLAIASGS